jgi:hypothetical protein
VELKCADQFGMLDVATSAVASLDGDRGYGLRYGMGERRADFCGDGGLSSR